MNIFAGILSFKLERGTDPVLESADFSSGVMKLADTNLWEIRVKTV